MSNSDPSLQTLSWRRWISLSLRFVVTAGVILAVTHRIWMEKERLAEHEFTLRPWWLAVSGACYLAGLATCAAFWRLAMRDRGAEPSWTSTLAAYYAGHLGKYVPGKGLVLVIRATMVRGAGVSKVNAAITAAHETSLMMATGAVVAVVALCLVPVPHRAFLLTVASVVALALGTLSLPPFMTRLGRLATRTFGESAGETTSGSRWATVVWGALLIAIGWLFMGLSLGALEGALGNLSVAMERYGIAGSVVFFTAIVSLATVGGFVSLTPGGLGSREWILMEMLGPVVGIDRAIVAAIVLRLVWIVAEVCAVLVFWSIDRQWNRIKQQGN